MTERLHASPGEDPRAAVARAAERIRQGGLVAFPTETVYGLGARADDAAAVRSIFAAKGRPPGNPLIVHVAGVDEARALAADFPEAAEKLAAAFWPGPLTLVVTRRRGEGAVVDEAAAGGPTVALRVPAHPVALALLRAAGLPIAAPSANRSSGISPTTADHVLKSLAGRIDVVLDGGPTGFGIESSIVDVTGSRAVLLRHGAVALGAIAALAPVIDRGGEVVAAGDRAAAPGSQARHYAPRAEVRLLAAEAVRGEVASLRARARTANRGAGARARNRRRRPSRGAPRRPARLRRGALRGAAPARGRGLRRHRDRLRPRGGRVGRRARSDPAGVGEMTEAGDAGPGSVAMLSLLMRPLMRSPALARFLAAAALAALSAGVTPAQGAPTLDSPALLHSTWLDELPRLYTFRLDDVSEGSGSGAWSGPQSNRRLSLLDAFRDAAVEPGAGLHHFSGGWSSRRAAEPWPALSWAGSAGNAPSPEAPPAELLAAREEDPLFGPDPDDAEPLLSLSPAAAPAWLNPSFITPIVKTPAATFASNGAGALWSLPPAKPVPNWRCRRRPVRMARYGGESDAFLLVRCDGSAAAQAFDRLTLMAREATSPRPGELLPDEPDPDSLARGEWTPGVRLVHPRLLWVLQRIADAFPWRTVYVFSGYRHDPSGVRPKPGSHHSMHSEARAMDIYVMGIPNAALFQVCQKLADVGCGFYPNNKFVHVDVRRPGSGHPFWIDVSGPGEPSRYVDAWPGVIEGGGLVWDPVGRAAAKGETGGPGAEASCTTRDSRAAPPNTRP